MIIKITKENYNEEVVKSNIPVILDFYANWCGPCKMMTPILEEIAKEQEEKVKIGKVNIEEETKLASDFGIMNIPTLVIFQNGKMTKTLVGLQRKETILKELEK